MTSADEGDGYIKRNKDLGWVQDDAPKQTELHVLLTYYCFSMQGDPAVSAQYFSIFSQR